MEEINPLKSNFFPNNVKLIFDKMKKIPKQKPEDYVKNKIEKQGIKIEKIKETNGAPDFKCEDKNKIFYIEVKGLMMD